MNIIKINGSKFTKTLEIKQKNRRDDGSRIKKNLSFFHGIEESSERVEITSHWWHGCTGSQVLGHYKPLTHLKFNSWLINSTPWLIVFYIYLIFFSYPLFNFNSKLHFPLSCPSTHSHFLSSLPLSHLCSSVSSCFW